MANLNIIVQDANNLNVQVTPQSPIIIALDKSTPGVGIESIVPVTIETLQYLRITYTNGVVQDVGPLTSTAYFGETPINITGNIISLDTVGVNYGGTGQTSYTDGQLLIGNSSGNTLTKSTLTAGSGVSITNGNGSIVISSTGLGGDVVGPSSATDNAIARYDTTTGKLIQNSVVIVNDAGTMSGVESLVFDGSVPAATPVGTMWYDQSTETLNFQQNNITQQIGEETLLYGKASEAINDSPLQIIYQTGVVGASGVITFAPTIAGITDANLILGCATEALATNQFGRITVYGAVHGINTTGSAYGETWADGDVIWYNPVTGNPTKTKPTAPNIKVQLGIITHAGSGGSGTFQVLVRTGSSLGGTDDNVQLTSPSNGQILSYNGADSYWKNTTLTAGTGISVTASSTGVLTVTNTAPSSGGTVTSVSGAGTVNGLTLTGIVTTSGSLTLGGTLDLSSPPTIGNTTPNTGAFTTLSTTGNAIISDNSSNAALRITQTGSGNALLVEDSANPDSSPFVIDANGVVLAGLTAAIGGAAVQISGGDSRYRFNSTAAGGAFVNLFRSRSSTIGANTILQSGDQIGGVNFLGADGTGYISGALISTEVDGTPGTSDMPGRLVFSTTADGASSPTERMRIGSDGSVGVGVSNAPSYTIRTGRNISGATSGGNFYASGTIQSDVTSNGYGFISEIKTAAASFVLGSAHGFRASQGTIGAGSSITNQYGFHADSTLTGATNNYGFYGNLAAATGRYNLYINGTANNYLAGSLGVGTTSLNDRVIGISKAITGATASYGIVVNSSIQSDVTSNAQIYRSGVSTAAATFTLPSLQHFIAAQNAIGAGSTVTNQYGFSAESTLTGATNNYGFYGGLASGTGRYNLYMAGTADNYLAGNTTIAGTTNLGASVATGTGVTTGSANIEIGGLRTGDGSSYIDFHSTSATDYETRIIRNSGINGNLLISNTGTGDFSITQNGAANLIFQTSATERMRINSAGEVGIGASTLTAYRLRIGGFLTGATTAYGVSPDVIVASDVTGLGIGFHTSIGTQATSFTLTSLRHYSARQATIGAGSTLTNQYGFWVDSTLTGATNNYGFYSNIASGTGRYNFYAAGTADNYLAGNVGIGTSSPNGTLNVGARLGTGSEYQIVTNGGATGAYSSIIKLGAYTPTGAIGCDIKAVFDYTGSTATNLTFGTVPTGAATSAQPTERMRIDSSGNLLVGTTSAFVGNGHNFQNGNSTSYVMGLRNANAIAGRFWIQGPDNGNNYVIYNQSNAGVYLANGGTSWSANSDERLKTEITPFENAVEKVSSLRAGTGRYLTDDESVSRSFLIAQDVQKVLPEAVNVQDDEIRTLGLAYTDLIPLLTAAIQELNAKVTALETQLGAK